MFSTYIDAKIAGSLSINLSLPDGLKRKHFGPDTLSVVAILTGVINTSKRKVLAMLNEVFSVPTSLLV